MPVEIRELPHGAVLYHILNGSRLCRIEAVMRTGSIHEGNETGCGLSHFLEHMLFQGCARYPGTRAADTIHSLGGECNAYTTFDHTAYYAEVPAEQFTAAADVICAMITEPLFPEAEFNSEKEVIAREADMIADRPGHAMVQQLWQGLFPNHPAGMPIIGYADKIAGVTRQMMHDYYLRRYGAMRCHFLVTGDINTDMAAEFLSNKLAAFTRGNLLEPALLQPGNQAFAVRRRSVFADPLTRMAVGIRAPEAADKITPALDLLGGIIGGSDSSLLPRELLYGKELAMAVDSEFDGCTFGSVLGISAVCEPRKAAALEKNLAQLLKKIRSNGITKAELQREKRQQQLTMYQLLKNTSSTVNLVNSMVMNFNCCDVTSYLDKLNAVTLDEINAAAAEYLDENRMVWSIVEPADTEKTAGRVKQKKAVPEVYSGKFDDSCQYVV
ncbi:MAG: insulinase family protein, partial [Lentisphaeria bacterium]|nr:insulinase family protein [Lentisphaeria bacterium]